MPAVPRLIDCEEIRHTSQGLALPALLWRAGPGWRMASSAVVGGGIGERGWFLNAQVQHGYRRRDPEAHLREIAAAHVAGEGVAMMTAAEISRARGLATDGGAEALVTAGVGVAGWAAVPAGAAVAPSGPGTVNILAALPVPLSDAALVNAVATATEAKVQALVEAGYEATGTPTDAVCVAAQTLPVRGGPWATRAAVTGVRVPRQAPREPKRAPGGERPAHAVTAGRRPEESQGTARAEAAEPAVVQFAGPRSEWGARLARAVHGATAQALVRYAAVRDARAST
ncbi:adenosylcobinamide amidohydrolase [Streptomyces sulphureus]|uniref:adenosylcobinamide amidohydrolase n=1 Tax=Streptomyces sulphureus TaxID=47758 RepID=UPI000475C0E0